MYQCYYKHQILQRCNSNQDLSKGLSKSKGYEETGTSCENVSKVNFLTSNLQFNSSNIKETSQRFMRNESTPSKMRDECSNNSEKSYATEIKAIPRNQINTFKAFRNSTFRLVFNGTPNQGLIINNSNNSNRFSTGKLKYSFNGSNNSGNTRDASIDKINKRIMLKKITELATPYNTNSDRVQKPFQRIIPHPILDDKSYNKFFNSTNSNGKINNNYPESDNEDSMNLGIKTPMNNLGNRGELREKSNDLSKLENYEIMLRKELQEIKQLKNEKFKSANELLSVYCSKTLPASRDLEMGINNFQLNNENSISPNPSRLFEDFPAKIPDSININKYPIKTTENSKLKQKENIYTNSTYLTGNYPKENSRELFPDSTPTEINSNQNQTTLISEIEVCVDEFQNSFIPPQNISHISLYFQYDGGKKFKFKLKYLSKFSQAQKVFCDKLNINSLLNLKFMTESGQIIRNLDTPSSLDLKQNDIIIVTRNVLN